VDEEFTGALPVLTHRTRVEVLRTPADAEGLLSVSEPKSRVGVSDSGRFDHHLSELTRHFLRRPEEDYGLTYRGKSPVVASTTAVSVDDAHTADDPDCDRPVHVHLTARR